MGGKSLAAAASNGDCDQGPGPGPGTVPLTHQSLRTGDPTSPTSQAPHEAGLTQPLRQQPGGKGTVGSLFRGHPGLLLAGLEASVSPAGRHVLGSGWSLPGQISQARSILLGFPRPQETQTVTESRGGRGLGPSAAPGCDPEQDIRALRHSVPPWGQGVRRPWGQATLTCLGQVPLWCPPSSSVL